MLIEVADFGLQLKGRCTAIARSVFSGKIVAVHTADNQLFSVYKNAIVRDLAYSTNNSQPIIMGFSRDVVPSSPQPTELTNEFRTGVSLVADEHRLQILAVLGSTEGNEGGGNIRSIGFYMGNDAVVSIPGSGTLCSLINTMNVPKTAAIEVTFQYEITFN